MVGKRLKSEWCDPLAANSANHEIRLGLNDLLHLFGDVVEDSVSGRRFIMVDNADPRGGFHADSDHEGFANDV